MAKFFKAFFLTLLILVLLSGGLVFFVGAKVHDQDPLDLITDLTSGQDKDNLSFLLIGVDSLDKNQGKPRSDVMMAVHINRAAKSISLVSIPRDTRTPIEGRKNQEKINHAFAYGGPDLSLKTVNNRLGTKIPYYMVMDYEFVKDMVDIMGGVEVDIPMEMNYEDTTAGNSLIIHFKPGRQKLNGEDAVKFLRFRKGYKNADLGRVQAQQQFMGAFLKELKNPAQWAKAPLFAASYQKHAKSTVPLSSLMKMAPIFVHSQEDNFRSTTLPGNPQMISGLSYFILDDKGTERVLTEYGLK